MPRRFIVLTSLAAGTAIAVAAAVATPALAKGATQASITGPGLARPVTISAQGEALPGQSDTLSSLAGQTGLFTVLFGPGSGTPDEPSPLRTPPAAASLGPRYTLTYTVPGVTPGPGQPAGQVRQYLYPRAAGGPMIDTLPGQQGFGQPLQATGWLRGTPQLTATLTRLGVPAGASLPSSPGSTASVSAAAAPAAVPKPGDTTAPAALIATIVSAVVIAVAGTAWWLRRRSRSPTPPAFLASGLGEVRLAAAGHREGTPCRSSMPTGTSSRSRQAQPGWRRSWLSMIRACRSPRARNGRCASLSRTLAGRTGGRPRSRGRGSDALIPFREVPDGKLPGDRAGQPAWLLAGAARIVDAVREAGSDLVWSFTGPVPAGFWLRRMAHETLVHRADAQLAAGGEPEPVIEAEVAADAIDEWLMLLAGGLGDADERAKALPAGAGLHLHATDDGLGGRGEWMIRHDTGGLTVEPGHGKGDAALTGPAASLLLVLMRRRPVSDPAVTVYGDTAVVDGWLARTAF